MLMRLLERRDPYLYLYIHYHQTLARLTTADVPSQCLRDFEIQLMKELGYGLLLDRTADNDETIDPDCRYDYHLEQGPVRTVVGRSEIQIRGRTLICLHNREKLDEQGAFEAKRLMRRVINFYIGDKPEL
ncbi:MAG: DNA repair protein RecO C-terminal domain-containing protein [Candidatus Thiodiazotropha sp. (ex Lucinoma aequizonata)]|nr:DNA repair protein RecO C-terminal domain-containing protein [Candidatus Thiodiazotropha sp. (ex Lucinoma aequizonata)]MCU7887713.1 DNA repair protein RecO C-terminal domain-containing protein [Candidatus Thiodiazotropha sp. (ex Lucinoma aequizonata)]MCU7894545.1 DNA repair protein RecO C-terminal domain-containing protein [Candidatus Thiodiazotropha sp. (ex Lucinoma aequizonata)]MCU7897540.1 DNA repair protein RecO C-terminal domain-containing protein [Candidatus Thiodiazotropha sp. (ex Luci